MSWAIVGDCAVATPELLAELGAGVAATDGLDGATDADEADVVLTAWVAVGVDATETEAAEA